ncbi:MAG: hypothetical protein KDD55_00820 [Bdellovibrionales bacterium]|nr:hypothetical protein [Bdellovibrionales bacterium]
MNSKYKRINVLITPEQHEKVLMRRISLSGLIRDLLDDWFSDTSIQLTVTPQTKHLYDLVISNFGASDKEIEPYIVEALDALLADKTEEIGQLRKQLREPSEPTESDEDESTTRKSH